MTMGVIKNYFLPSIILFHNRYFSHDRFERSQQLRGDRSEVVAIVDCWLWLIMAENLFSKTIIRLRHRFAIANNSRTQTSRPRRHRLTNPSTNTKEKTTRIEWSCFCGSKDWLLRRPRSAPLNAFPFRLPRGPLQNFTAQWVVAQLLLFSYAYAYKQVCVKAYKNKKMSITRHLIASFVLWELTDSNRRPSACKADALNQLS